MRGSNKHGWRPDPPVAGESRVAPQTYQIWCHQCGTLSGMWPWLWTKAQCALVRLEDHEHGAFPLFQVVFPRATSQLGRKPPVAAEPAFAASSMCLLVCTGVRGHGLEATPLRRWRSWQRIASGRAFYAHRREAGVGLGVCLLFAKALQPVAFALHRPCKHPLGSGLRLCSRLILCASVCFRALSIESRRVGRHRGGGGRKISRSPRGWCLAVVAQRGGVDGLVCVCV